jgi:hypothetical protein
VSRAARRARRRPGRPPDWELRLPPEWKTDEYFRVEVFGEAELPNGARALIAGTLLKDGTNILGLLWPGGQRIARVTASTNWALEERFTGTVPQGCSDAIAAAWRFVVNQMVDSAKHAKTPEAVAQMDRTHRAIEMGVLTINEAQALLADYDAGAVDARLDELEVPE